jgi:predicted glycosyltransferase
MRNHDLVEPRQAHLLVSAGGGIVGAELFRTALQARVLMRQPLPMRFIAGPFLPESDWRVLQKMAEGISDVEVLRQVPDMVIEMRRARASISQCGYNTALDMMVSQVPALVVPYATKTENEQNVRASRLASLGAVHHLSTEALNPQRLAEAIDALMLFKPRAASLDLNGAWQTAQYLHALCYTVGRAKSSQEAVCKLA